MAKHLFFLGKGGVGKSTISALTALQASRYGKKVLLISLDPAHNQSDIFDRSLSDKPQKIKDGLEVCEADLNAWIKKYLGGIEDRLKKSYQYLTAFNLDKHLDVIRYSPGIEEYALLLAYESYTQKYADKDLLIFDMPPTALTLKFFSLPQLSLLWLEKLTELRRAIHSKKEIISKIKFGKKEIESDRVLHNLAGQMRLYQTIEAHLLDPDRTELKVVMNPDKLSLSETELILKRLKELHLPVNEIMLNKYKTTDPEPPAKIREMIKTYYPVADTPLIGQPALEKYLDEVSVRSG